MKLKSDVEVLDEMLAILTPDTWVQGTWCVPPRSTLHLVKEAFPTPMTERTVIVNDTDLEKMCLDGALRKAVYGVAERYTLGATQNQHDQYARIYLALLRATSDRPIEGDSLMSYNDSHSFEDVALAMKEARERLVEG